MIKPSSPQLGATLIRQNLFSTKNLPSNSKNFHSYLIDKNQNKKELILSSCSFGPCLPAPKSCLPDRGSAWESLPILPLFTPAPCRWAKSMDFNDKTQTLIRQNFSFIPRPNLSHFEILNFKLFTPWIERLLRSLKSSVLVSLQYLMATFEKWRMVSRQLLLLKRVLSQEVASYLFFKHHLPSSDYHLKFSTWHLLFTTCHLHLTINNFPFT